MKPELAMPPKNKTTDYSHEPIKPEPLSNWEVWRQIRNGHVQVLRRNDDGEFIEEIRLVDWLDE